MRRNLELRRNVSGVGRVGIVAAWVSGVCCLPYLVLKVLWALGIPLGVSSESVLDDNDWVVANALMAAVQVAAVALVVALVRPSGRRLPAWLLLFPAWVGTGLLFQVAVGAALSGIETTQASAASVDPIEPWVYVLVYAAFAVQGAALAVAFAAHVRARWGHVFSIRSGEVVCGDGVPEPTWPQRHLADLAAAVAWLALLTAIAFSAWPGGGAFVLDANGSESSEAMRAARATGAALAALGLFGLASRWGSQIRFWMPAALLWVGSGALAAFDGLSLILNGLAAAAGTDSMSGAGWELTDTVLLIKVCVGVLAAAVGVVALRIAAAKGAEPLGRPT